MELEPKHRKALIVWATDCAAHVLRHYERANPTDTRPREAIEAGQAWAQGEMVKGWWRKASRGAMAAAKASKAPAARAAAQAAALAAATVQEPEQAQAAALYALKAAEAAGVPVAAERAWQRRRLPRSLGVRQKKAG